ncbi:M15 family metallopeptidase [Butyrivibrio proteoclasticus]|uniref:M15 family metallopeptidase n=1 Tax=Butyrivibrio proteoclasticus TaxID=43305 RepID=UPI00047C0222|nr:M15 family metallopeptidase [Butyrivibrio proteoclasticus]
MNKKLLKDIALLLGVIVVFAVAARYVARGETLEDYAKRNPSALGDSAAASGSGSESSVLGSSDYGSLASSGTDISASSSSDGNDGASNGADTSSADSSADSSSSNTSTNPVDNALESRITYMDGFYYEPIPDFVKEKIMGVSYKENDNVSLDDLRYCVMLYVDFNGETQTGEMICNKSIAQDVLEIFYELYQNGYQIQGIKLIDEFGGDDHASMLANNTSCFNYREVDGTTRLSNHAYGLAIDLNPFYNPYVTYGKDGSVNISPEGSEGYADRNAEFPYKIDENDLAYKLFIAHGFKWGGNWNSCKDYQHFEKK